MKSKIVVAALFTLLAASAALADVITVLPDPPLAGLPFQVRIDGAWRDSATPEFESLSVSENVIDVVFRIRAGGGLSAQTPYSVTFDVPALSAGTYKLRAKLFDFNGPREFFEKTIVVQGTPSGIASLSPSFDTSAGNRVVTLSGLFPCEAAACAAPQVFFGTIAAEGVARINEQMIQAVVPAQTNVRVVDVTVRGAGYEHVLKSGFTYVSLSEYERILLPIYTQRPVPGAYGSRWQTDFRILNTAEVPFSNGLDIFPVDQRCGDSRCATLLAPGALESPALVFPDQYNEIPPTVMLYVRKTLAPYLSFALRTRDLSRQAESWGTEVPVVRERDLATMVTLADVPAQPRFRRMLRIYMTDYVGCCGARVSFHDGTGKLLTQRSLNLTRPNATIGGLVPSGYRREGSREFPLQPAYTEMRLEEIAEIAGVESLWIRVESTAPPARVWAFVSITSDTTQQITLVTPQ